MRNRADAFFIICIYCWNFKSLFFYVKTNLKLLSMVL